MAENENGGGEGCCELIALAGLAIAIGLPILIKCFFTWLIAKDKLKSRQPDGKHPAVS